MGLGLGCKEEEVSSVELGGRVVVGAGGNDPEPLVWVSRVDGLG